MEFKDALRVAAKNAGWSVTKIAAEAGVSEGQARKWLAGTAEPRMSIFQTLRTKLPGFADMVDRAVKIA